MIDDFDFSEIVDCDSENCGCPCFDYCKDKMDGVGHFSCEEVYRQFLCESDFKKANEKMDSSLFGLEYQTTICESCTHAKECTFSDYNEEWDEDGPAVTTKCNFYQEDWRDHL